MNFGFSQNCLDGKIDPALTDTSWWNTVDTQTGRSMGGGEPPEGAEGRTRPLAVT